VVPFLRVRERLNAWKEIGAGRTVLNWIKYGYRLPFVKRMEPFYHKPKPCSQLEYEALEEIKAKLFSLGVVEVTSDTSFVSRSRLEPKKDGGFRLIVDLRHVNDHLAVQSCKYETLGDLQLMIQRNDFMISCDLADGYYHMGIHPEHQKFLTTSINGTLLSFKALPFGLSTAPRVFTKFMRPVVAHLRKNGQRMLQYLDDSLFLHADEQQLSARRDDIDDLLLSLGLQRKPSKGVWEPTRRLKHLGVEIDTERGLFLVPDSKRNTIMAAARSIIKYAAAHRRWVHVRKLANLAGAVIALTVAMPVARTVTRSLYDVIATKSTWESDVRLTHQALRDLQFLAELPSQVCDKAIWRAEPLDSIHTDASDTGWGAVLNNLVPAQGFFNKQEQAQHITAKELSAVLSALQQFNKQLQSQQTIKVITDNMSVRGVLNKGTSSSPQLMSIYRQILELCLEKGVLLQAEYIPTELNVKADFLSRINPAGEWSLPESVFKSAEQLFGRRSIDLFASPNNKQCNRFCSVVPGHGSLGDAFQQDWSQERSWICPPFALIGRVVERLMRQGGEAVVIVPYWTAAPWFPSLMQLSDYHQLLHRGHIDNATHLESSQPELWRNPKWRLMLFHIPERERVLVQQC
jgi:hypothetical protein